MALADRIAGTNRAGRHDDAILAAIDRGMALIPKARPRSARALAEGLGPGCWAGHPSDRKLRTKLNVAVIRRTIEAARADRNAQRDRSIRLLLESGTLMCDQVVQRLLNALAISQIQQQYADYEADARAAGDLATLEELGAAKAEADQQLGVLEAQMRSELSEYADLIEGLGGDYSLPLLIRHTVFIAPEVERREARRAACLDALESHLRMRVETGFADARAIERDLREIAIARGTQQ